jgi:hypothetical protein
MTKIATKRQARRHACPITPIRIESAAHFVADIKLVANRPAVIAHVPPAGPPEKAVTILTSGGTA